MSAMYELSDAELDAVSGGQANGAGGLVAVAVQDVLNNPNILNGTTVTVSGNKVSLLNNSVNNDLNGNKVHVGAGVLVNLLSGPSGVLTSA